MNRILRRIRHGIIVLFFIIAFGANGICKTVIPANEDNHIRLAVSYSGHVLAAIAEDKGFLQDEGIDLELVTLFTPEDAFAALTAGKIDLISTWGTNLPLRYIAEGGAVDVFGGYMLSGAVPVVTREGVAWDGVETLIGKKVAGHPNIYAVSGPLMDKGYDAINDVEWIDISGEMDRLIAVKKGQVDFAIVGTGLLGPAQKMKLKIACYLDDVLPEYSCCRVVSPSRWIIDNPTVAKGLLKSWIRAQEVYERDKEYTTKVNAKQIEAEEDFVRAYMMNPHFIINVNPNKKATKRAWNYLDKLGVLGKNAQNMSIDEHINTKIYKEALDECIAEHYEENPTFYDKQLEDFQKTN